MAFGYSLNQNVLNPTQNKGPITSMSGGLGQQYLVTRDEEGNTLNKQATNKFNVGMGGSYSSGTAGRIVTQADLARQAGIPEHLLPYYTSGQATQGITPGPNSQYDAYNRALALYNADQTRQQQPGMTGGSGGSGSYSSSYSSSSGYPGGSFQAPPWSTRFRDDALSQAREQFGTQRDAELDALEAAGIHLGGARSSAMGEIGRQQALAERGIMAEDEAKRLAHDLGWAQVGLGYAELGARDRQANQAAQWNAAQSLVDAGARLKAQNAAGGGGGGSQNPYSVFGATFGPSSSFSSLPSRQDQVNMPLSQMDEQLIRQLMSSPTLARQKYGLTYDELEEEWNRRSKGVGTINPDYVKKMMAYKGGPTSSYLQGADVRSSSNIFEE